MSRIGYAPIQIPENVEVNIQKDNVVHVKGPKGEITQKVHPNISVQMEDSTITFERPSNQKRFKAYHGLYRSLVANMIEGVNQGYQKQLELIGVGFKATTSGQVMELSVGYSHDIVFELPEEISASVAQAKGGNPIITLESHDKQLVGQIASKIRSLRKPEPYNGKGIRYVGEKVRSKAGKAGGK